MNTNNSINKREKLTIESSSAKHVVSVWDDNDTAKQATLFETSQQFNTFAEGSTERILLQQELSNSVIRSANKARPVCVNKYFKKKKDKTDLAVRRNHLNDVRNEKAQIAKNKKRNAKRRAKAKANKT